MKITKDTRKLFLNCHTMTVGKNGSEYVNLHFENRSKVTGRRVSETVELPIDNETVYIPTDCHAAHAHIYMNYHGSADAIKALLRDGDDVTFRFFNNDNGYVRAASIAQGRLDNRQFDSYDHLHHDVCAITITRNGKTVVCDLPIEDSVCPDNSARMIS
jgi:hypothetical protein